MKVVTWESYGADFTPAMEYAKYKRVYVSK
jgi:hypothetical protein